MAFGDIGGAVTELVVTCQTPGSGAVAIAKGDPLKLTGDYTIDNVLADEDPVFGQALASADRNGQAIPVKVKGVCIFTYTGSAPTVNGLQGVLGSATGGTVKAPASGNGNGVTVNVDAVASKVHVLI